MQVTLDNPMFEGSAYILNIFGNFLPGEYTGPRDEYLPCRESAWLGVCLNTTPVLRVSGPDAAKFFEQTCVNHGFATMKVGSSKHALVCNTKGHMIADGVVMRLDEESYTTYWLAPVLQYFAQASGLDLNCEYITDEYFFQIDGPKSLQIMEEACECDLHDIKFAHNKKVKCCGTDMTIHRLGMSGALAYEVHGKAEDAPVVYKHIREIVEKYGGKPQGASNYGIINHTPAGYPNQLQHFNYPLLEDDPGLAEFAKQYCAVPPLVGSASDDPDMFSVTPYEIGWGYLINFDHEFMGKDALLKAKDEPHRQVVTLEWNAEDVGDVFMSMLRGRGEEPYDQIEYADALLDNRFGPMVIRGDKVLAGDETIGIATGRTIAYYEQRMISLAFIDPKYAEEGTELEVLWGAEGYRKKRIRATVAQFPYYQGEYRNETFDTSKIPPYKG
ncbi:MAG: glycine cleavage T C-terminal barrel domain-containing protein [Coriobacteriales bacterium]|jgi:glycine cleavage system aminomethyltransferase T